MHANALVTSLELASLGGTICVIAVTLDSTRVVCTLLALIVIANSGTQALLAGHRTGLKDGQGSKARFNRPNGITVDSDGSLLVSDTLKSRPAQGHAQWRRLRSQVTGRPALQTGLVLLPASTGCR